MSSGQPHRIALNLHVAFLHDVEQADLDLAGQVGKLVDGKDATIGARQQAVMHGQLVRQVAPAARGLDGVDVADHVGNGYVGCSQFFDISLVALHPVDRSVVSLFLDQVPAASADRVVRIVANLAAGDVRQMFIQQRRKHPDDARLGLPTQAEQNEVVPGKNGVDDLWHYRIVIADHSGEQIFALLQLANEVLPQLVFHASRADPLFGEAAGFKSAESRR